MEENRDLLRALPPVDALLRREELAKACGEYGRAAVRDAVRAALGEARGAIRGGAASRPPCEAELSASALARLAAGAQDGLRRVINATGVALHTNLGRAPLAGEAARALQEAAGYSNLEYDLASGKRGSRGALVEPLLCALCGSEAALVVNNNAAALLLALSTLAKGREILVSRGELVEIGDGFRVPEIMAASGGRLVEVGATNKTRLSDYENAVTADTGLLLKVHTSNYRVVGFTASVPVEKLARLGRARGLPVLCDLGSGAVLEAGEYPFPGEPTAPQALRDGADLVCFSGDKLLGGPQAGILLGRRELIEQMRRNPLARALRIDKFALAALAATLRLYRDPERAKQRVPALASLLAPPEVLREKALRLCGLIERTGAGCTARVAAARRPAGGGAAPGVLLDGFAAAVEAPCGPDALEARLRAGNPPVIARIADGVLLLDVAAIPEEQLGETADALAAALR